MPTSQRDIETHKQTERQLAAMRIAKRLAACDEPLDGDVSPSCTLCSYVYYIGIHDEDCPWRMARELLAEPVEH